MAAAGRQTAALRATSERQGGVRPKGRKLLEEIKQQDRERRARERQKKEEAEQQRKLEDEARWRDAVERRRLDEQANRRREAVEARRLDRKRRLRSEQLEREEEQRIDAAREAAACVAEDLATVIGFAAEESMAQVRFEVQVSSEGEHESGGEQEARDGQEDHGQEDHGQEDHGQEDHSGQEETPEQRALRIERFLIHLLSHNKTERREIRREVRQIQARKRREKREAAERRQRERAEEREAEEHERMLVEQYEAACMREAREPALTHEQKLALRWNRLGEDYKYQLWCERAERAAARAETRASARVAGVPRRWY
eukprot:TRINITY_DN5711_c0_g2_i3.p2 TRINITY_DN5711_c0_g2~~TRINITY_DN5711_c0_g2_i3.p2  ORF type:complete len:315 (+),score=105.66 TRINITY_DN5711_c0_g2_i3:66-1010(+)